MAKYWENDEYVRDLKEAAELQSRLQDQPQAEQNNAPAQLTSSRRAMLALIDQLARGSTLLLGFAAIMTIVIVLIATASLGSTSLDLVTRIAPWVLLVAVTLGFTVHRLLKFRRGLAYNGHPFTWRSHYTATLAVFSTAFGTGAILLTPADIPPEGALLLNNLILGTSLVLGMGHLAHRATALSVSAPSTLIALSASLWHILPATTDLLRQCLLFWSVSVVITMICVLLGRSKSQKLVADALKEHPRNEMLQIKARQKKASGAYNPFSIRTKEATRSHPALSQPERAVAGGD